MKMMIAAFSLISINALAQVAGQPFQLNVGKYSLECWYSGVTRTQGSTDRYRGHDIGIVTVLLQANQTNVEYFQSQSEEMDNSLTKTITTDLGNNVFKQVIETTVISSSNDKNGTRTYRAEGTKQVDGRLEINLNVKNNDGPEEPGAGELIWEKMADGRIVVQSYQREKKIRTTANGKIVELLAANSTCIYQEMK